MYIPPVAWYFLKKCITVSSCSKDSLNTSNTRRASCSRKQEKKNRSTVMWFSSAAHSRYVSLCVKADWRERRHSIVAFELPKPQNRDKEKRTRWSKCLDQETRCQIVTEIRWGLCSEHQLELFQLFLWDLFFPVSLMQSSKHYTTHEPQQLHKNSRYFVTHLLFWRLNLESFMSVSRRTTSSLACRPRSCVGVFWPKLSHQRSDVHHISLIHIQLQSPCLRPPGSAAAGSQAELPNL